MAEPAENDDATAIREENQRMPAMRGPSGAAVYAKGLCRTLSLPGFVPLALPLR